MAKKQPQQANNVPEKEQEKTPPKSIEKASLAMTRRGFEPTNMEEAWRLAQALSESDMVPDKYKGKPRDCLVVLDLAARLDASWLAVMQHVYSVYGRVSMESALVTALVNQSGMFVDPLEYEVVGEDAAKPDYKVRAIAKRKSTGTVLYGPWIDWKLVKAEGWYGKKDSKWQSMPEQMFHYRAASWFQRRHCPEVTMGMLTTDEAAEIGPKPKHVDSTVVESGVTALKERLEKMKKPETTEEADQVFHTGGNGDDEVTTDQQIEDAIVNVNSVKPEPVDPDERPEEVNEKINQQKEKLASVGSGSKKSSNLF